MLAQLVRGVKKSQFEAVHRSTAGEMVTKSYTVLESSASWTLRRAIISVIEGERARDHPLPELQEDPHQTQTLRTLRTLKTRRAQTAFKQMQRQPTGRVPCSGEEGGGLGHRPPVAAANESPCKCRIAVVSGQSQEEWADEIQSWVVRCAFGASRLLGCCAVLSCLSSMLRAPC